MRCACAGRLVAESRGGGASPLRAPRIGRFRGPPTLPRGQLWCPPVCVCARRGRQTSSSLQKGARTWCHRPFVFAERNKLSGASARRLWAGEPGRASRGGADLRAPRTRVYVCMVCVGGGDPTRATQPSLGLLSRAMVVPPHCARPGVPPPPPQGGPLCARALVAESRGGGASPLRAPRIGRFRGQGLGPDRRSSATTATRKRIAPQRCAAAGRAPRCRSTS